MPLQIVNFHFPKTFSCNSIEIYFTEKLTALIFAFTQLFSQFRWNLTFLTHFLNCRPKDFLGGQKYLTGPIASGCFFLPQDSLGLLFWPIARLQPMPSLHLKDNFRKNTKNSLYFDDSQADVTDNSLCNFLIHL